MVDLASGRVMMDLIETSWNVKVFYTYHLLLHVCDLIETSWNVKMQLKPSIRISENRFNRNIVECKVSMYLSTLAFDAFDLIETSWNVK